MTKEEYLNSIKKELGFMPLDEVEKAEKYFASYFTGNEEDEKVAQRLGNPKYAAENYYRTHVNNTPEPKVVEKRSSNGAMWVWIIALVILSPIVIPVSICLAVFVFAVALGLLLLLPAIFLGGVSMWLGGAGIIIRSLFIYDGLANMAFRAGTGCVMFGVGLLLAWIALYVCIKFFPWLIRKIVDIGSKLVKRGASK